MRTSVDLYEPLHTLKPVAPNLWTVDGPVVHMAYLGTRIPFPTRMTVARLPDGGLWLHSPTELVPELAERVAALGTVAHLVSPNALHYTHIADWKSAFPDAITWASPGVRARAESQGSALRFDEDLGEHAPDDWCFSIDQLIFRGSRLRDEVVFFHRASRTLVVADLIENFEADTVRGPLSWATAMPETGDPDAPQPVDLRGTDWGRRNDARASFERVLAWRPERVVVAHGRCYDHDGEAELRRAFHWLS